MARWEIREVGFGKGVFARDALLPGEPLFAYEGPKVRWEDVPDAEAAHVIKSGGRWVIPGSPARYVNHACEPNCDVDDDLRLVPLRTIAPGEELTIDYHTADPAAMAADPGAYFWDPRWSFDCRCGSPRCVGRVDGWRIVALGECRRG